MRTMKFSLIVALLCLALSTMLVGCDMLEGGPAETEKTECAHAETEWYVLKEPTCVEEGEHYQRCVACYEKLTENEPIETLAHNFVNDECKTCGSININDAEDLIAFSKAVNEDEKTFKNAIVTLMADIDLTDVKWQPIALPGGSFYGIFDGNGHKITGLKVGSGIEASPIDEIGFFAFNYGTIKNLTIENAAVSYGGQSLGEAGILVGENYGKIENCSVSGTVSIYTSRTWCYSGGLVGVNEGKIIASSSTASVNVNSDNDANVNSGAYAGGLVGRQNSKGSMLDCYATGDAYADGWGGAYAGGLTAQNNGSIVNCYALGNATAVTQVATGGKTKTVAGGLVGNQYGTETAKLENCFAAGNASATGGAERYAGVLTANVPTDATQPVNCYYLATATANANNFQIGTSKTEDDFKAAAFATTLTWSADVWTFADGAFPTLK